MNRVPFLSGWYRICSIFFAHSLIKGDIFSDLSRRLVIWPGEQAGIEPASLEQSCGQGVYIKCWEYKKLRTAKMTISKYLTGFSSQSDGICASSGALKLVAALKVSYSVPSSGELLLQRWILVFFACTFCSWHLSFSHYPPCDSLARG